MMWLFAAPALVLLAVIPKAPGVFGYWHRWRGFGIERALITRLVCGFWSYDLMPGSLAERVAKITSVWTLP